MMQPALPKSPTPLNQTANSDLRPIDRRRADYRSSTVQDRLMVKVLARFLTAAIDRCTAPAGGSAKALDIGCGGQPLRSHIESRGLRYFGMDVVQPVASPLVDFLAPIDAPLPPALLAQSPFALILCTEVLEHVADWPTAFHNMAALLAPGGRLIITCPHVWPYALRHYAECNGLRVIEESRGGDWYDVLGTLVAFASFDGIPFPGLRWLSRKSFALLRRIVVCLASSSALRSLFPMRSMLYLSTCAVLEKA